MTNRTAASTSPTSYYAELAAAFKATASEIDRVAANLRTTRERAIHAALRFDTAAQLHDRIA
jgi:hypothetical protein